MTRDELDSSGVTFQRLLISISPKLKPGMNVEPVAGRDMSVCACKMLGHEECGGIMN